MDQGWVKGIGVVLGLLVAMQVGYVRATRTHEEGRAQAVASAEAISRELDATRGELSGLALVLERVERERALLAAELARSDVRTDLLRRSTALLRDELGSARQTLRDEPAFLDVLLVPGAAGDHLRAEARSGAGALRITEVEGQLWADDELLDAASAALELVVEPGPGVPFFEFTWDESSAAEPQVPLEGLLCVAYERLTPVDATPFVERVWFRRDPAGQGGFLVGRQLTEPLVHEGPLCESSG